ncbi:hypothetical protein GL325_02765 [Aeromicrobium sp. 636]|uniref:Uncharacterized protein n=1 Tax=Aeromicrobium senzhongii TaxID=2663859 RepID=A0A8I0ETQ6_9ACTN|nr:MULTISPECIES: hypothetical protein [Aeromicrobium]MBC9225238.1 hypothetical protein [Aeromicrobium senzhongii]MCQ3997348.1 hypothetical protein [Aeromicrobium sp. 636]
MDTWVMFLGAGAAADAGDIHFDLERGTEFEIDGDGTLHIRSDYRSFALAPTGEVIAPMPPTAPPQVWSWWSASAFCCGVGILMLLVTSVARDNGWSSRGQIVTLVATVVAAIGMVATSVLIWRHGRETSSERNAVVASARNATGLPLTRRQARRFVSATKDYIVAADGTAWAVHESDIYRGDRTA